MIPQDHYSASAANAGGRSAKTTRSVAAKKAGRHKAPASSGITSTDLTLDKLMEGLDITQLGQPNDHGNILTEYETDIGRLPTPVGNDHLWSVNIPIEVEDEDGTLYTYYVVEDDPGSDYTAVYSGQSSGLQDKGKVTISNQIVPRDKAIILKKVGVNNTDPSGTQKPLGGAVFTVYTAKGDDLDQKDQIAKAGDVELSGLTSDKTTGVFFEGKLPVGTYLIEETDTPPGYESLGGLIKVTVPADGDIVISKLAVGNQTNVGSVTKTEGKDEWTITIINTVGIELPSAGGPGTTWIYLLGSILLLGCGTLLAARRRIV